MAWYDALANIGGSLLGGVASAYGANASNSSNLQVSREGNTFSAQQAALNRDYQTNMSNTSWQRGTADMKAAGINPMLAFSQGGASSPSGNSAQGIAQANQQNEFAGAQEAIRNALRTDAEVTNLKTQAASNIANSTLAIEKAKNERFRGAGLKAEADIDMSKYGKVLRYIDRGLSTAGSFVDMFNPISGAIKAFRPSSVTKTNHYDSDTGVVRRSSTTKRR